MNNYGINDITKLLHNAGLDVIHIENEDISLVDRKELAKVGKVKKDATYGEIDLIAFHQKVVFLIEFTMEKRIDTKDFDNFIIKVDLLLENNKKKLSTFVKQLKEKRSEDKTLKKLKIDQNCEVKGLYVKPTLKIRDEKTLAGRIPDKDLENIFIWGQDIFEYFKIICGTTRSYSKYELFSYFDIEPKYVINSSEWDRRKKNSDIRDFVKTEKGIYGNPMYTFKITPSVLLDRVYVLRNEGWRSDSFQRMIISQKLAGIRKYILKHKNTQFANNIIISLDPKITSTDVIKKDKISLPYQFSSMCIIDGQHRLLAFTQNFYGEKKDEEKKGDKQLAKLSKNTEILVTLIAFNGSKKNIVKNQTQLFLDINSNQTKIKTDFIYNLREITDPRSPESIGNKIIRYLTFREHGVFEDKFEIKSYDSGKIKRSSIVTYGIKDLVDTEKNILFSIASNKIRKKFSNGDIEEYIEFCGKELEKYFKRIKIVLTKKEGANIWDVWRKSNYMILSTSSIVAFLRLYRHFISSKVKKKEIPEYIKKIQVDFKHDNWEYTSSQWGKLEAKMFYDIRDGGYRDFGDVNLIPKKHRKP